jgi:hypothetical protein
MIIEGYYQEVEGEMGSVLNVRTKTIAEKPKKAKLTFMSSIQ